MQFLPICISSHQLYLSDNPHFCKSALARYTHNGILSKLVQKSTILLTTKKTLGQLFCDDSAQQIVDLLLAECHEGKVSIRLRSECDLNRENRRRLFLFGRRENNNRLLCSDYQRRTFNARFRVPPFGYKIAQQFGLNVLPTRAGLVPFYITNKPQLEQLSPLSGCGDPAIVTAENGTQFKENILLLIVGFFRSCYFTNL